MSSPVVTCVVERRSSRDFNVNLLKGLVIPDNAYYVNVYRHLSRPCNRRLTKYTLLTSVLINTIQSLIKSYTFLNTVIYPRQGNLLKRRNGVFTPFKKNKQFFNEKCESKVYINEVSKILQLQYCLYIVSSACNSLYIEVSFTKCFTRRVGDVGVTNRLY